MTAVPPPQSAAGRRLAARGVPPYLGSAMMSVMPLRPWPAFALTASLLLLAAAHGFQHFGGLYPCALCLRQREAHWIAAGVAALALAARLWRPDRRAEQAFNALLAVAFAASAIVAAFHAGVEFKWWPGLPSCAIGGELPADTDLLGALSGPVEAAGCDVVPWSFLGLSMAAWNMVVSLGLALVSGWAALVAPDDAGRWREPSDV